MRHNAAAGEIIIMLRCLKVRGMAQAVGEQSNKGSPAFEAALPILSQLLKAEAADREARSTAYQLKAARFRNYRDLTGLRLGRQRGQRRAARIVRVKTAVPKTSWRGSTLRRRARRGRGPASFSAPQSGKWRRPEANGRGQPRQARASC